MLKCEEKLTLKYKYSDCGKIFITQAKLKSHRQVVHARGSFLCDICAKEFKNKDYLRSHVRLTHEEGIAEICDRCSQIFRNKNQLYCHQKAVHNSEVHTCKKCDDIFKSLRSLKRHIVKCLKQSQYPQLSEAKVSVQKYLIMGDNNISEFNADIANFSIEPEEIAVKDDHNCGNEIGNGDQVDVSRDYTVFDIPDEFQNATQRSVDVNFINLKKTDSESIHNIKEDNEVWLVKKECEEREPLLDMETELNSKMKDCSKVFDLQLKTEEMNSCEISKFEEYINGTALSNIVTCQICFKEYSIKTIHQHTKHVHGNDGGNCPTCDKFFPTRKYLRNHITQTHVKNVSEELKIKCKICSNEFPGSKLKAHMRNYHSGENLTCELCSKSFKSLKYLKAHFRNIHSSVPYKPNPKKTEKTEICDICSKMFSKYKLNEHQKDVHGNDGGNCPTCGKFFATKKYLQNHVTQTHMKKESEESLQLCEFCPKVFEASKIKAHVRNYHSRENLDCNECGKTFTNLKYFRAHAKLVHSATIELCQICPKTFSNQHYLRQHIRLVHESTENAVQCDICSKSFGNKSRLHHHMKAVHSNEDSSCQVCSKTYKNVYLLRKHMNKYHAVLAPNK